MSGNSIDLGFIRLHGHGSERNPPGWLRQQASPSVVNTGNSGRVILLSSPWWFRLRPGGRRPPQSRIVQSSQGFLDRSRKPVHIHMSMAPEPHTAECVCADSECRGSLPKARDCLGSGHEILLRESRKAKVGFHPSPKGRKWVKNSRRELA